MVVGDRWRKYEREEGGRTSLHYVLGRIYQKKILRLYLDIRGMAFFIAIYTDKKTLDPTV